MANDNSEESDFRRHLETLSSNQIYKILRSGGYTYQRAVSSEPIYDWDKDFGKFVLDIRPEPENVFVSIPPHMEDEVKRLAINAKVKEDAWERESESAQRVEETRLRALEEWAKSNNILE